MPRTIISDSFGVKQVGDSTGLQIDSALSSSPTLSVNSLTAASTLTAGGVYTIAGSGGAVTTVMPLASTVPGSMFVFRGLSAHAHVLTGSQESNGTKVFCGTPGLTGATGSGSSLALSAVIGSSVVLVSDGKSFVLTGMSGSITISGT